MLLTIYADLLRNLLEYQNKTNANQITVLLNEHFESELTIRRAYSTFYWLLVPTLEIAIVTYPIYMLFKDPKQYLESDITKVLTILSLARTVLVTVCFFVAMVRMHLVMRRSYKWLMEKYNWQILIMGVTLLISLSMAIWIDILSYKEVQNPEAALRSDSDPKGANIYHWIELIANIAPGLAIALVYPPTDMFKECNKYPE